jgi:isoleucyl-tRNA synthetase
LLHPDDFNNLASPMDKMTLTSLEKWIISSLQLLRQETVSIQQIPKHSTKKTVTTHFISFHLEDLTHYYPNKNLEASP